MCLSPLATLRRDLEHYLFIYYQLLTNLVSAADNPDDNGNIRVVVIVLVLLLVPSVCVAVLLCRRLLVLNPL